MKGNILEFEVLLIGNMEVFWCNIIQQKRIGDSMPIVEISGPALPQDAKDRIAKKITEIIAEEEKKAFKIDTTSITVVGFRDVPVPNIYLGTKPLAKVLETLPKA
jgi:phenylpyruvate tautomerase PptA (4-oxalocrotonate tautomerase family)